MATREDIIIYAGAPIEGFGAIPEAIRTRIAHDTAALNLYAGLLEGRLSIDAGWDSAAVVYWLVQSGRVQYLPLLAAVAQVDHDNGSRLWAVYGLALHDTIPLARRVLATLLTEGTDDQLRTTVAALGTVNDATARALLRTAPRERLHPDQVRMVDSLVAPHPLPPPAGYLP